MLQSMGSQRVRHDLLNRTEVCNKIFLKFHYIKQAKIKDERLYITQTANFSISNMKVSYYMSSYKHLRCLNLAEWLSGKEFACQCRRCRRHELYPCVRKILWRRKWQPTLVLAWKIPLAGQFGGVQIQDHKELNTTECAHIQGL